MATITAQSIIDKAETLLLDTTNVRWPVAELLGWLNDGQRHIVSLRPDANPVFANVTLVSGTKQSIPSDGYQLLEVVRNMGANGATPGRAIRRSTLKVLNTQAPEWHAETASTTVEHYMADPRWPKVFFVYPPATAGRQVEVVYSKPPTDVPTVSDVISLDDIYATALLDYVLYRAYSKDYEVPSSAERAVAHYQAYEAGLGMKAQADAQVRAA
jgi:hypothetical protein